MYCDIIELASIPVTHITLKVSFTAVLIDLYIMNEVSEIAHAAIIITIHEYKTLYYMSDYSTH